MENILNRESQIYLLAHYVSTRVVDFNNKSSKEKSRIIPTLLFMELNIRDKKVIEEVEELLLENI